MPILSGPGKNATLVSRVKRLVNRFTSVRQTSPRLEESQKGADPEQRLTRLLGMRLEKMNNSSPSSRRQARLLESLAWDVIKNYPDGGLCQEGTISTGTPQFTLAGQNRSDHSGNDRLVVAAAFDVNLPAERDGVDGIERQRSGANDVHRAGCFDRLVSPPLGVLSVGGRRPSGRSMIPDPLVLFDPPGCRDGLPVRAGREWPGTWRAFASGSGASSSEGLFEFVDWLSNPAEFRPTRL